MPRRIRARRSRAWRSRKGTDGHYGRVQIRCLKITAGRSIPPAVAPSTRRWG